MARLFGFLVLLMGFAAYAQQPGAVRARKPFGEIRFAENFVERGVSMSELGLSTQASFGYDFGGARLGVWTSNVRFQSNDEHLNYRLYFSYLFDINPNWDFLLRYDTSQYSLNKDRNAGIFYTDLGFYTYHLAIQRVDNWFVPGLTRVSVILYKRFELGAEIYWDLGTAYNSVSSQGYSSFFDAYTALSVMLSVYEFGVNASYNSGASQFNGMGDAMVWFSVSTKF